jgi:alanyl aminopeptidase
VEAYGQRLFHGPYAKLGWTAHKDEETAAAELRRGVLSFMANTAKDPAARAEAKKRGAAYLGLGKGGAIHEDAVDKDLLGLSLFVLGQDADAATWDAMRATFAKTNNEMLRGMLLSGLSAAKDPASAARARELALDPAVRTTEASLPVSVQLQGEETREAAWRWMQEHFDAFLAHVSQHHGRPRVFGLPGVFCDEAHLAEVERFLAPKAPAIEGAPRVLASTLEDIRLCIAKRKAEEPAARAFFAKQRK